MYLIKKLFVRYPAAVCGTGAWGDLTQRFFVAEKVNLKIFCNQALQELIHKDFSPSESEETFLPSNAFLFRLSGFDACSDPAMLTGPRWILSWHWKGDRQKKAFPTFFQRETTFLGFQRQATKLADDLMQKIPTLYIVRFS